jgi:hypothetical protein
VERHLIPLEQLNILAVEHLEIMDWGAEPEIIPISSPMRTYVDNRASLASMDRILSLTTVAVILVAPLQYQFQ